MHYVRYPTVLQFEISSNCNLSCTGCSRTDEQTYSMKGNPLIPKNKYLSLDKFKEIIQDPACKDVKTIEFCGTIDDPAMHPQFLDMLEFLQDTGIVADIHTNGSLRTPDYWKTVAELTSKITTSKVKFNVDGLEDTNHLYRRGSNWNKIMDNAAAFIAAGGTAVWQYLVFDWNKHQVEEAKSLAANMGFSAFKYRHDRAQSVSAVDIDNGFARPEWKPTWERLIVKAERKSAGNPIECFSRDSASYFIGYNGEIWPCCFLHNAKWSHLGTLDENKQRFEGNYGENWNNVYHYTFSEILNSKFYTEDLYDSWKTDIHGTDCKDRLIRCSQTCTKNSIPIGNHSVEKL